MAQIGTPPAGWYTDPSGQHRARYWDGAGWTEQVRNDIASSVGSSAGSASRDAAATVAGVAHAVAAVAEQDVVEPAFVVDYGVEAEPFGATRVEPFGSARVDPFGADPRPSPVPAIPEAAPVASGPTPGWYPDPSARHQARLWDGTRWTERVADNGIEGIDPVPGAPAAWSAQLLSETDVDGALPHVDDDAAPQVDDDAGPQVDDDAGPQVSAGQASLAKLGESESEYWDDKPVRTRVRPTGKIYVAGWMILAGAVALLAGSTMPWMQVRGPGVGDSASESGVNLGDGRLTIVLAVVLAVLGVGILTGRLNKVGGTKVGAMGALVAGAAAVAVTAVDIADVAERAHRLGVQPGAVTDVGPGLWICFVGALVAVAGGLMAFANRR